MGDAERKPWERLPDEPGKWFARFEAFRLLGPDRSLLAAFNQWRVEKCRQVSTRAPHAWLDAAARWHWRERSDAWDRVELDRKAAEAAQRDAAAEARKQRLTTRGHAAKHQRVRSLRKLALLLERELYEEDKRWLPDVKGIGKGDTFERVEIVRFNAPLIEQFRKTLDDIAIEVGERRRGLEVSGPGGQAIPITIIEPVKPPDSEPDPEPDSSAEHES